MMMCSIIMIVLLAEHAATVAARAAAVLPPPVVAGAADLPTSRRAAVVAGAGAALSAGMPRIVLSAGAAPQAAQTRRRRTIDSHLHVWTPDVANFPRAVEPPENLDKDGFATFERFISLMDKADVGKAVIVQPVNYGQDYSYLVSAMDKYPDRLKGMFVADATVDVDKSEEWLEKLYRSNPGWVGMRFNPYKFAEVDPKGMGGEVGLRIFRKAGELGIPVGIMPFKGLSQHIEEVKLLLASSPQTKVIIDHWGFFLQPATGFGDRTVDEESWKSLLSLADQPQVHVKLSAMFRVAADKLPFESLSDRLAVLLKEFGSSRLMWGSDFPFVADFCEYPEAVDAIESWPLWQGLSEEDHLNIKSRTASTLFNLGTQADDHDGEEEEELIESDQRISFWGIWSITATLIGLLAVSRVTFAVLCFRCDAFTTGEVEEPFLAGHT